MNCLSKKEKKSGNAEFYVSHVPIKDHNKIIGTCLRKLVLRAKSKDLAFTGKKKTKHKTDHKRVRRKRVEGCALSKLNMDEDLVNNKPLKDKGCTTNTNM